MSQHCFECRSNEGYVTVMLGWDEALQWFHMFIGARGKPRRSGRG